MKIKTKLCPLCGKPNDCAMAANADIPVDDCWCRHDAFPKALLAHVPEVEKNKSCICNNCLQAYRDKK